AALVHHRRHPVDDRGRRVRGDLQEIAIQRDCPKNKPRFRGVCFHSATGFFFAVPFFLAVLARLRAAAASPAFSGQSPNGNGLYSELKVRYATIWRTYSASAPPNSRRFFCV